MKTIQLHQITALELSQIITDSIGKRIDERLSIIELPNEERYLTRADVKDLLKISYPTLHEWINRNILKAYKVGNRTYFKKSEIDSSLILQNK